MTVKRYDIGYSGGEFDEFESDCGDWVKFDDIKHLIEKPKCSCGDDSFVHKCVKCYKLNVSNCQKQ